MGRWLGLVLLLASCYRPQPDGSCVISCETSGCPNDLACDKGLCHAQGDVCGPNGVIDASVVDAAPDTPDGGICLGNVFSFCNIQGGSMVLDSDIDTSSSSLCDDITRDGIQICVIAFQNITVAGTVHVTGTLPLALVADQIAIPGGASLEVVAAANAIDCPILAHGITTKGAGGGAGGSSHTLGGDGGSGASGTNLGGMASGFPQGTTLAIRGGCAGGDGSTGDAGSGGAGGSSGGVIILISQALTIGGTINAAGHGGKGAGGTTTTSGGGGGGAGGLIVLDTPFSVMGSARILASGGGGGAGADGAMANPGDDGDETNLAVPAAGGAGNAGAGAGGIGAIAGNAGQVGHAGNTGAGGGGGGGGMGYIYAHIALTASASLSPATTQF